MQFPFFPFFATRLYFHTLLHLRLLYVRCLINSLTRTHSNFDGRHSAITGSEEQENTEERWKKQIKMKPYQEYRACKITPISAGALTFKILVFTTAYFSTERY